MSPVPSVTLKSQSDGNAAVRGRNAIAAFSQSPVTKRGLSPAILGVSSQLLLPGAPTSVRAPPSPVVTSGRKVVHLSLLNQSPSRVTLS